MCARVARGFPGSGSYWDVESQPHHETLLAFDALEEVDRIDGLIADVDAVNEAYRTRLAVTPDPEPLNRENTSAVARLGYDPNTAPRRPSPEELSKAAQAIFSKIRLKPQRS